MHQHSANVPGKPRLLDQVRDVIRVKHYSIRTEQAYVQWIKRYIFFHGKRHPSEMGEAEVSAFLTHLAVKRNVASSTQNQALNALVFLYREVLKKDLDGLEDVTRAKKPARLPLVFTRDEVRRVLAHLEGDRGRVLISRPLSIYQYPSPIVPYPVNKRRMTVATGV